MNLTNGTRLQNGKYTLDGVLGQRGLGLTLKATQAYLNQPVVLKTLKSQTQPTDTTHLKRHFLETARRFARCQHPGLVRIIDLFEEAEHPFVVMDFVAGQSLSDRGQTASHLTESQALHFIRQAGAALGVIHRQGLVHGDVHPGHLIRPAGADFVVLVGFNLLPGEDTVAEPQPPGDRYWAIEQHTQSQLTSATDIYALSATLYYLVTGQHPLAANLREPESFVSPRQLRPDLSPALETAITGGMALQSSDRPQTVAAWLAQLPQEPITPAPLPKQATAISPTVPVATNGAPPNGLAPQPGATPILAPEPVTPASVVVPFPRRQSRLPKAVVGAAAIAAAIGLGLGLALRLGAATGFGPKIFHTQQTFPPLPDWVGAVESASPSPPAPAPLPTKPSPKQPAPIRLSPSPLPSPEAITATPLPDPVSITPSPPATVSPPAETPSAQPTPSPQTTPDIPAIKSIERSLDSPGNQPPSATSPQ